MYKRIHSTQSNAKKPLRIVELKSITKEEIENFKKHLSNTPLKRAGVVVVE